MSLFGKKGESTVIDLPVKERWATAEFSAQPYFDIWETKAEAEDAAKKIAQKRDVLVAVYRISVVGSAAPHSSIYEDFK